MSKKMRRPLTTIFIACEGKNTEPIYFERIKEEVEECNFLAITIYPDESEGNPKTDALGLVREAQSRISDYDEVWVVYDKNGYTKHKEAMEEAKTEINGKRVKIAFSSIAFEHWVLLHFEKNNLTYAKSANIIDAKFAANETYYLDYSKRANIDIYPKLKHLTEIAIENASWLRFQQKKIQPETRKIYEKNPYTDVDILVKRLFHIEKIIEWGSLGERLIFGKTQATVIRNEGKLQAVIHNRRAAFLMSDEFKFSIIDSEHKIIPCLFDRKKIEPNQQDTFSLCDEVENVALVKIESESTTYFVEI